VRGPKLNKKKKGGLLVFLKKNMQHLFAYFKKILFGPFSLKVQLFCPIVYFAHILVPGLERERRDSRWITIKERES